MSRAGKRVGFGANRGATNPKTTVSTVAPSRPKKYDIWHDISTSPLVTKYWDGSAWQT